MAHRTRVLVDHVAEQFARGNHASTLMALDLAMAASRDEVARALQQRHALTLGHIYNVFIGDVNAVPRLVVPMSWLHRADVDHRTAFFLSRMDGVLTAYELLDVAAIPRLEATHCLCMMALTGAVRLS